MRYFSLLIGLICLLFSLDNQLAAQALPELKQRVYLFELNDNIFPSAWRSVSKAMDEAEVVGADYFIMKLNTYGGAVDMADSIRTRFLRAEPTTIVLIDNNAASAGALISLACDSIYMVEAAQIGAATVVVGNTGEAAPDKYQSYMRATMRSTAEAQGRDPQIAEAMVDQNIYLPGIIDSGKVLTLTTSEAIKYGVCDGQMASVEDVIEHLGLNDPIIIKSADSWVDKVLAFLMHPMVNSLLIMMIFGGLYFELQTPGVGFPLAAATVGAVLYFAPHYLEGFAQYWEIGLFVIGFILLLVEVFALPGFGVAGISGLIAIVAGLSLSLVENNYFDFSTVDPGEATTALTSVLFSLFVMIGFVLAFGERILESGPFKRIILSESHDAEEGFVVGNPKALDMLGKTGEAVTEMRNAGIIEIDNERFDAMTQGEYLEKGAMVEVVGNKGIFLVVKAV